MINCTMKVIISMELLKVWSREQCLHQTAGVGGDIGPRPRRPKRPGSRRKEEGRSNSVDSGSSEDPADPRRRSSPMVITASLTIPMSGAFTLNLDDPDIPYIEEAPKQPSAPPRRQRQRSISGCSEGIPSFLTSSNPRRTNENVGEWLKRSLSFQVEDTEATAPWAPPPRCRATRRRVPPPRGHRRHRPAPTARWQPSPTSPTNRPFFKGCRSRRRARCGRWAGRARSRRRGAPRPRTRRASRASAVRFWGEGIHRFGRNWPIGSSVLVFERNIWGRVRSPPREI